MLWTHIYDLLLKLATLVLSIILLVQIPFFESNGELCVIVGMVLFFFVYYYFVRTLATYLYCRLTLKMPINFSQAKELNNAFSPFFSLNLKWLPMTELKDFDDDVKYQVALDTYKKWAEENKRERNQKINDFKNAQQKTKILTVIMYIILVYVLLASFMNLPPASYITEIYCRTFNTEEYYPILNSLILVMPTIILFKILGVKH